MLLLTHGVYEKEELIDQIHEMVLSLAEELAQCAGHSRALHDPSQRRSGAVRLAIASTSLSEGADGTCSTRS